MRTATPYPSQESHASPDIDVLAIRFDTPLPVSQWQALLATLSPALQARIERYRRWQDRQALLLSRILLRHTLIRAGLGADSLARIVTDPHGRPYLPEADLDFNLAHTTRTDTTFDGGTVVCALTCRGRVGVDVEWLRPIDWTAFRRWLSDAEWRTVQAAEDPSRALLSLWTRKESVLKADGRGLSLLESARVIGNKVALDGKQWFCRSLSILPECSFHLAFDQPDPTLAPVRLDIRRLSP